MKDRSEIEVSRQIRFGDNGMEADEEVETDLTDWGVAEPDRKGETKYEETQASEFGVDDRYIDETGKDSEQETLFVDADDGQQTLDGRDAGGQFKFGD